MSAPAEISLLVERFREQFDSYLSPSYNETQLRREFVDPFFKALGWDNASSFRFALKTLLIGELDPVAWCFR